MNELQRQFIEHLERCGSCGDLDSRRCWQGKDLMKQLAQPNDESPTVYQPCPQIDEDFPPRQVWVCMFCQKPFNVERRGGMNAMGFFVMPHYVESRPEHKCYYDVPMKEKMAKSGRRSKRAPVSWNKAQTTLF